MTDPDARLDQALDALHAEPRHAPAQLDDARGRLLAALDAEAGPALAPVRELRPARPLRKRMVLPIAATAAAVLAATAVIVQVNGTDEQQAPVAGGAAGTPAVPPALSSGAAPKISLASAEQALNGAADLQVNAVDQPLKAGQYRYLVEHAWWSRGYETGTPADAPESPRSGYTYLLEQRRSEWIPADERQDWLERREVLGSKWLGGSVSEAEAGPLQIQDTDKGERRGACGNFFPKAKPVKVCGDPNDQDSAAFYQRLPRDPDKLLAFLKDFTKGRGSTPSVLFHFGLSILSGGRMPADLRSDWYRAMAKIPGVKVLDTAVNLDGHTGVALGLDDPRERRELILDPGNGDFLGERSVTGPQSDYPWLKPGTVTAYSSVTTAVADGIGQLPK